VLVRERQEVQEVPRRLAALATFLLALVVAGSARAGATPWTFADLEPPDGTLSYALDVNLNGQATGVMTDESGFAPVYRGFFYDPASGLVDISDLGGSNTFAVALNDRGVVTGTSQTDKGAVHAFLYTPGVGMRDIGANAFPSDISDAGAVIGRLGPNNHVFFWSDAGGFQDLGPGTARGFDSTGAFYGAQNNVPGRWTLAGFTPLGPLPSPFTKGEAFDGNIFGEATGRLTSVGGDTAFAWGGPSLDALLGNGGTGQSINNAGSIAVHATDSNGNDVAQLFDPPYDTPRGNFDGWTDGHILDFTAIDDVGHVAGAKRNQDGAVHGFVMTPYFPLQAASAVSILRQGLPSSDPFRTMSEQALSHLSHGVSETGCFQMTRLRKTLSVATGTHFTPAQRSVAEDALAAVLHTGECGNALPVAPTTVPHIFSHKNERVQFSVRLVRPHRISVFIQSPPEADIAAVNVPKKRVKEKVRITLVARRLLDGGATPATVTVR
jgi:probable HAF family extracellular repeat protein